MKILSIIINKILYVLSLTLFMMMFSITTINVFTRYLFNNPVAWAVELGRYCFVSIIFLGAIYVMRENGHIGLDVFVQRLPNKLKKVAFVFDRTITIIFLILFTVQAARMTLMNTKVLSAGLEIPMAIPYSFMVIGGVGMLIELVLNLIYPERAKQFSAPPEK